MTICEKQLRTKSCSRKKFQSTLMKSTFLHNSEYWTILAFTITLIYSIGKEYKSIQAASILKYKLMQNVQFFKNLII